MLKRGLVWIIAVAVIALAGILSVYVLMEVDRSTTFTVTYDLNGGVGECPKSHTVHAGSFEPDISNPPTKTDYQFVGWGKDSSVKSGFDRWPTTIRISSDTILYAIWSPIVTGNEVQLTEYNAGFSYSSYGTYKNHIPSDGFYYVVVKITITDVSFSGFESISSSDFTVEGSDSKDYSVKSSPTSDFCYARGTLDIIWIGTVGKTSTLYAIYELPVGVTPEVITFDGDDEYTWKWV